MKVNITFDEEDRGLVFKKRLHVVTLSVTLSEEEKAIIKEKDIGGVIIMDRGTCARFGDKDMDDVCALRFNNLVWDHDDVFRFTDQMDAKAYAKELKEKWLPMAKQYLEVGGEEPQDETFEL